MKTTMEIEFETKKFNDFYPDEYVGDPSKCPPAEKREIREQVERALHENFVAAVKELVERRGVVFDALEESLMEGEAGIEGFEALEDYGDVKIRAKLLRRA